MLGALGVARPSLASLAARALSPHHRARRVHTPGRVLSMAAPKIGKDGEKVYPEECKVEVGGRQYRRCAAALVFNPNGDVLLGERSDRPGSWGMPQGGIEIGESQSAAATRELYEEVGMKPGATHGLALVAEVPPDESFCYAAGGWLAAKGLAGQRLEFTLFHLDTTADPSPLCVLEGLGGETREFTRVKWASWDEAVSSVWESKRGPYVRARELAGPVIEKYLSDK